MIEFKMRDKLESDIKHYTKLTKGISLLRLVIALAFITFLVCLITLQEFILYGILSGLALVLFIVVILCTNKYYFKLSLLKNKNSVYENHLKKRKLDLKLVSDTGSDFLDKNDYKLSDLDIFGNKSLFQYLTSAKTAAGRRALATQLKNPIEKPKEFTEAIYELGNDERVIDLEAAIYNFTDNFKKISYKEMLSVVGNKIKYKPLFLLPILSFIGMIVYLILVLTINLNPYVLLAFIISNFALARITLKNEVFELDSSKYSQMLDKYQYVIETVEKTDFKSPYYVELKNKIVSYKDSTKKITRIFNTLSSRKNFLANVLLNSLCIYDLITIVIYNLNNKRASDIEGLFESVGELELLISLANVAIDNEVYSVPTKKDSISGVDMYHPLVKDCVKNSFTLAGGVILTGSNMSGKTTFMRTLGVNQILFNAGGIVFASSFNSFNMPVFTSLRANDMLQEGISTFYAEILRMKLMNEAINNGKCLLLVDEIFKGTNAYERIEGSKIIIQKFNEKKVLFIISTHDFELCECSNILNYHFNESYNDDKISFDYKIKEGKCESTNALYLLKLSNII